MTFRSWKSRYCGIEELVGKTLTGIEKIDNDKLLFTTDKGAIYRMFHEQDCCEIVEIEEIIGDLDDLVGTPIGFAEAASGSNETGKYGDTSTWTFYKLATVKGHVTLRWLGSSNGYYSESVEFVCQKEADA